MNAGALADMRPGFADPVGAAQQVFRSLLQAMARPGRVQALEPAVLQGLQPPALQRASGAALLTLLDADTRLHLVGRLHDEAATRFLAFHTGLREAAIEEADFVVAAAQEAVPALWERLHDGSDLAPQAGATLIVEVPALSEDAGAGTRLRLRGPGIRTLHCLRVEGLSPAFWQARIARQADFPRGIDLVLACGDTLAAVPRTTQIELEA